MKKITKNRYALGILIVSIFSLSTAAYAFTDSISTVITPVLKVKTSSQADSSTTTATSTDSTTSPKEKDEYVAHLNQEILNKGLRIKPIFVEDNRCPSGSTCAESGELEVRVAVRSSTNGMELVTMVPGKENIFAGKSITLTQITQSADFQDATFGFTVKDQK